MKAGTTKFLSTFALSSLIFTACNTAIAPTQLTTQTETSKTAQEESAESSEVKDAENPKVNLEKAPEAKQGTTTAAKTSTENYKTTVPEYLTYTKEVYDAELGKKPLALFFHAKWCETCIGMTKAINADLNSFPKGTMIFEVDYDTEKELEKAYGITMQSTIVIVGKNGKALQTLVAPDNETLKKAITASL